MLKVNRREFIASDPVQFAHRFESLPDIEIASLLAASIGWGKRTQIVKDGERLMQLMHNSPHAYLRSGEWRTLPDDENIHRTAFTRHLKLYLAGLERIYRRHGSLQEFARSLGLDGEEQPAWLLAAAMQREIEDASGGESVPQMHPSKPDTSALKRLNMALRWLVRRDGIVDLGVWDVIAPGQLFVPMDVHVVNTSRELGLLTRKSVDRKGCVALTGKLREFDPADPVKYDFALFGLGMSLA